MKQDLINVNSLTDIISNSVGILVMFAVLNIANMGGKVYQLEVPIEHETALAPAFFICKENAMVYLEPETVFMNAMRQAGKGRADDGETFSLNYQGIDGQVDSKSVIFHPEDTSHWHDITDLKEADSEIRQTLDKLDGEKQFAYFFVYDEKLEDYSDGSGFAVFRQARQYLQQRHIKSGWRPADEDNPPYICFWDISTCKNYFPSYLATDGS